MSDTTLRHSKIASAIYLITSFFDDHEPLKWRLRGLSADLVGDQIKNKAAIGREVRNLFSLARTAGLVSDTNYDILARELARIEAEAENSLPELLNSPEASPEPQPSLAAPISVLQPETREPHSVIKDIQTERKTEKIEKIELRPDLKDFGAVSVKKNGRQSVIIALLKRKKEIMIKDVSPLIAGCSEKTIQRELLEMVSQGILKKIGEKRWTRYTLA